VDGRLDCSGVGGTCAGGSILDVLLIQYFRAPGHANVKCQISDAECKMCALGQILLWNFTVFSLISTCSTVHVFVAGIVCCWCCLLLALFIVSVVCCWHCWLPFVAGIVHCWRYLLLALFTVVAGVVCCWTRSLPAGFVTGIVCCWHCSLLAWFVASLVHRCAFIGCWPHLLLAWFITCDV
jgi:hypothetical protein